MINRLIANEIRQELTGITFLEKIGGLVKTIEKKERVERDWKLQKFPATQDLFGWDSEDYAPMIPDSNIKGLAYFEDNGASSTGRTSKGLEMESKLRLVIWYNKETSLVDQAVAMGAVLAALPEHISCGIINRSRVAIGKIPSVEENLFSRYTYQENLNQYLLHPYTAFAIDFSVAYTLNLEAIKSGKYGTAFDSSFDLSFR